MEKKFRASVIRWSSKNFREFPWRKKTVTPYQIFLAEMLLKRTTAKAAATVYLTLRKKFPSIKKLASAKRGELAKIIAPIGYPQRAGEMISAAKFIVSNFGGRFPRDKGSLLSIPFVGDYTSSAILSLAGDKPYPMVDSNVNRIICRVFFGKNPPQHITKPIKKIAEDLLPEDRHRRFNLALLDIGGTLCYPKDPKCDICPLNHLCKFKKKMKTRLILDTNC